MTAIKSFEDKGTIAQRFRFFINEQFDHYTKEKAPLPTEEQHTEIKNALIDEWMNPESWLWHKTKRHFKASKDLSSDLAAAGELIKKLMKEEVEARYHTFQSKVLLEPSEAPVYNKLQAEPSHNGPIVDIPHDNILKPIALFLSHSHSLDDNLAKLRQMAETYYNTHYQDYPHKQFGWCLFMKGHSSRLTALRDLPTDEEFNAALQDLRHYENFETKEMNKYVQLVESADLPFVDDKQMKDVIRTAYIYVNIMNKLEHDTQMSEVNRQRIEEQMSALIQPFAKTV